jgi:hypothetical protein
MALSNSDALLVVGLDACVENGFHRHCKGVQKPIEKAAADHRIFWLF